MVSRVLFTVLFAYAVSVGQRLPDPPEVAALSAWPADGKLPPSLEKEHIFRDLTTSEIVVSYPSPDVPGQRTTFRFELANRVDPVVSADVTINGEGVYAYRYTVLNGPRAEAPIRMWSVVGPPNDPQLRISHPEWYASRGRSPGAPQAMVPGAVQGAHLFWDNRGHAIPIGGTVKDFQIVSSYQPGLTTAYAVGDGVIKVPPDFTEEISSELLPFQQVPVKWRPTLTIGPRFPPEMSRREIASHFYDELLALVKARTLNGESNFLCEVITGLGGSIKSGQEPRISAEPRPGIEAQIAQALHVALRGDGAR